MSIVETDRKNLQKNGYFMRGSLYVTLTEIHMNEAEIDTLVSENPIFYKRFLDDITNLAKTR